LHSIPAGLPPHFLLFFLIPLPPKIQNLNTSVLLCPLDQSCSIYTKYRSPVSPLSLLPKNQHSASLQESTSLDVKTRVPQVSARTPQFVQYSSEKRNEKKKPISKTTSYQPNMPTASDPPPVKTRTERRAHAVPNPLLRRKHKTTQDPVMENPFYSNHIHNPIPANPNPSPPILFENSQRGYRSYPPPLDSTRINPGGERNICWSVGGLGLGQSGSPKMGRYGRREWDWWGIDGSGDGWGGGWDEGCLWCWCWCWWCWWCWWRQRMAMLKGNMVEEGMGGGEVVGDWGMEVRMFQRICSDSSERGRQTLLPPLVCLERPVCKTRKRWVFHLATSIGGMWWQGAERDGEWLRLLLDRMDSRNC